MYVWFVFDDYNCDGDGSSGVAWTEEEHETFLKGLKKLGKGDGVMISKQVSQRGGTLRVSWSEKDSILTLGGQATVVAKGELLY